MKLVLDKAIKEKTLSSDWNHRKLPHFYNYNVGNFSYRLEAAFQ